MACGVLCGLVAAAQRLARFRRVFPLLLVAAVAIFAPGEVFAQDLYPNEPAARSGCNSAGAQAAAAPNLYTTGNHRCLLESGSTQQSGGYRCEFEISYYQDRRPPYDWIGCHNAGADEYHRWSGSCPSGMVWDSTAMQCKTQCSTGEWPDPTNPGQCLSQEKCLARNAALGNTPRVHSSDVSCVAGCRYALDPSQGGVRTTGPGGVQLFAGVWRYTGDQCGAEPPPPPDDEPDDPPKKQQCVPVAGQTLCIKPSGEHCYSASTGRQICWKPGETGDKPDGDTLQRRVAGPSEIPPNLNLPNGDTLTRSGNPITTTTTTSTTTITTTTTNYRTTNGTNAGTGNRGEPADGSGGEGSDDDGTSASGGGDCKTPPVVQGDAALNMVALQAWHTRCEAERLRKVTSSGSISDCSAPYTVEGNDVPAQQLRALRKSLCPLEGVGDLPSESYLGTGDGEPTADDVVRTVEHDVSEFDTSGLGWGDSCPAIPSVNVFGTVIELDPDGVVCDWVQLGGWFVLLFAGFACLKILWEA